MIHNQTLVVFEKILKNAPKIHKAILLPHLQSVAPFFNFNVKIFTKFVNFRISSLPNHSAGGIDRVGW